MASSRAWLLALFVSAITLAIVPNSVDALFNDTVEFYWGAQHSVMSGDDLQLKLDNKSGSGFKSKSTFLYGSLEMLIKLVPGNSAGTVTTYYLSSTGTKHDEIDFEFLGNVSGQPYTIHTNVYTQGNGTREQQFKAWFDPTTAYHNYTIHWNPTEIVWYVDSIPIRVFRNYNNRGINYPNNQGMKVYASLWNADDWATQGGRVKTDWTRAPFIARYRNFKPRACKWFGTTSIAKCIAKTSGNWWTSPEHSQLSSAKLAQMKSVRDRFMIYDYCKDTLRFRGQMPPECSLPQF